MQHRDVETLKEKTIFSCFWFSLTSVALTRKLAVHVPYFILLEIKLKELYWLLAHQKWFVFMPRIDLAIELHAQSLACFHSRWVLSPSKESHCILLLEWTEKISCHGPYNRWVDGARSRNTLCFLTRGSWRGCEVLSIMLNRLCTIRLERTKASGSEAVPSTEPAILIGLFSSLMSLAGFSSPCFMCFLEHNIGKWWFKYLQLKKETI